MPDFTLVLPLEIFGYILSHVNQVECVECMTVCRRWYQLIPQYGKDIWKELEISTESWQTFNDAIIKCLGTHVEKVSLVDFENSHRILQRLQHQGCNLQSLEIELIFEDYTLDIDRDLVFNGIGLFKQTLQELFIDGPCTHYFSLTILLDLLPALTHLTIKFLYRYLIMDLIEENAIRDEIRQNLQSNTNDSNVNYNLVYLCLDSELPYNFPIKQIVKRCPQLKYLLVSEPHTYEYHPSTSAIAFEHIIELCPSIRYIQWGIDNISTSNTEKEWLTLSRRTKEKYTGNKYNNVYDKRKTNDLRQVEFYSNIEELHISTLKVCLQQPSLLEHFCLCGSPYINLYQLWNTFKQYNSNLLSQPSRLKSLELVTLLVPLQIENDVSFEDFFHYFQHLERLKLHFFFNAVYFTSKRQRDYTRKVFEAIGHQLHQLRYLYVGVGISNNADSGTVLHYDLLATICDYKQKLEVLHLHNVFVPNDMLLDFCDLPMLHTLQLSGERLHAHLTRDGWIPFAHKLKEQEQNNNNIIQSLFLSCEYEDNITDEVLEELAGIQSLKTLRIESNKNITDVGINKFANAKSNISKRDRKIVLYECDNVSLENPHVIFVSSRFFKTIH